MIQQAQSGDREAFCLLARSYERRIHRLAFHYCQNRHDAEDLSQEVWLKAYRAIGGFRGESGFYTWLRQITINTFLNHKRGITMFAADKQAIRLGELVSLEDLGLAEPSRNGEAELHQQMLVEKVMESLGELTPQQRLIFLLKHCEGMTYDEISQACAVSAGTIKKALYRAVQKLRGHLGIEAAPAEAAPELQASGLRTD
ncbi:MAG: sigma-70 family RNA polymerase sigma factor [Blastocatellia bacterium]|nr:sigma-70 family RNA polymerase sigma factor [Blastocatellia bacterium]